MTWPRAPVARATVYRYSQPQALFDELAPAAVRAPRPGARPARTKWRRIMHARAVRPSWTWGLVRVWPPSRALRPRALRRGITRPLRHCSSAAMPRVNIRDDLQAPA